MAQATGPSPFGFRWDPDKGLVVDPEQAEVRRRAFALFVEHRRKGTVARLLNAKGHRTSRGKNWTDTSVSNLLSCSSAVGRYWVNKTRKLPSGKRGLRPEGEWTPVPCERLIDDETWEAVQGILREQEAKGGAARPRSRPRPRCGRNSICGSAGTWWAPC